MGPVKIKDGLFMGDRIAAQDLEFLMTNKVSHIINCSGGEVPNLWENIGIQYLAVDWQENDSESLFVGKEATCTKAWAFIHQAHSLGESVLVHSTKGQSRCSCLVTAYLMATYRWSLYKALEFLNSRRPDLEIRTAFFKQLGQYETTLHPERLSKYWESSDKVSPEEHLVSNTYQNAQNAKVDNILQAKYQLPDRLPMPAPSRVSFAPKVTYQVVSHCYNPRPSRTRSIVKTKKSLSLNTKCTKPSTSLNTKPKLAKHQKVKSMMAPPTQPEPKINNITGNIIHVTVNNYLGPQDPKKTSDQIYDSILQNYSNINKTKDTPVLTKKINSAKVSPKPAARHQALQKQNYIRPSRVPAKTKKPQEPLSEEELQQKKLAEQQQEQQQLEDQILLQEKQSIQTKQQQLAKEEVPLPRKSLTKKYQPTPPRQYLNNNRLKQSLPLDNKTKVNAEQLIKKELHHPTTKTNKFEMSHPSQPEKPQPLKQFCLYYPRATYATAPKPSSQLKATKSLNQQTSKQILLELQNNNKIMNNYYNNKYRRH